MTKLHRACLFAAVLALPACVKTPPTEQSDKGAAATPPPPPAAVPPVVTAAPTSAAVTPATGVTLADWLAREAQNRPPIQPNADQVLAAMDRLGAGAGIATKRQGLGATYKASFCEGGTAGDGTLTVSVCEYPDADSARAGLEALNLVFPAKGARHTLHKNTVLTTLRLKDGAVASAREASVVSAYRAL